METLSIWVVIYVVFIALTLIVSYQLNDIPPRKTALTEGLVTSSTAEIPQNITATPSQWYPIVLPEMDTAKQLNSNEIWYVFAIPDAMLETENDKLCVYISSLSHNAEVFINTLWLGNGGRMKAPIDRNAKHPLIFNIDRKALLANGNNKLYVHVKGFNPDWTYLGQLYLGSESLLRPIYNSQKMLRINLVIITTIALIFTSLFAILLWLVKKEESYYLWYAVAELLWAVHDLNHFVKRIPFNDNAWESFMMLSMGGSVICLVAFIHRYVGGYNKKLDIAILLSGGFLALGFLYQESNWIIFYGYQVWMLFMLFLGIYTLFFMVIRFYKTREKNILLILLTSSVMISFGAHDLLAINGILPQDSPYIMHLSAIFIIIVITSLLIKRFMASLHAVEHHNELLQQALTKRERQLAVEYKKNQRLEAERLLTAERGRIMQDIHDGVGGQLVTMLEAVQCNTVPKDMLTHNLTLILQDLRLVIDSLDGSEQEITMILGTLRMRLEGLLEKANIKLIWQIDDLPLLEPFDPERSLNTMRIVQEAITNVIKHSQANSISVSTYMTLIDHKDYAIVEIKDNGNGALDTPEGGRGLANMRRRAARIQALLKINAVVNKGVTILLGFQIESDMR